MSFAPVEVTCPMCGGHLAVRNRGYTHPTESKAVWGCTVCGVEWLARLDLTIVRDDPAAARRARDERWRQSGQRQPTRPRWKHLTPDERAAIEADIRSGVSGRDVRIRHNITTHTYYRIRRELQEQPA